jgi:hypothetical protein
MALWKNKLLLGKSKLKKLEKYINYCMKIDEIYDLLGLVKH